MTYPNRLCGCTFGADYQLLCESLCGAWRISIRRVVLYLSVLVSMWLCYGMVRECR